MMHDITQGSESKANGLNIDLLMTARKEQRINLQKIQLKEMTHSSNHPGSIELHIVLIM